MFMVSRIVTEFYNEHNGHTEVVYCCDSPAEAAQLHEIATEQGFACAPRLNVIMEQGSVFVRILTADDEQFTRLKIILKLTV